MTGAAPASQASAPQGGSAPLWQLLQSAARVVQSVRGGKSANDAIAAADPALRPGTQALAFHALRFLGRAQALRAQLAQEAPAPAADALLCTALALVWDEAAAPYALFTLVDQAVEAAKRGNKHTRGAAGFINACLRRFLRERAVLVERTNADPVAMWNHPRWWIDKLREQYPQQWQAILQADNTPPPLALRVNAKRFTAAGYLAELTANNIEATTAGEFAVVLTKPRPVHAIPGFDEGAVSVQDAAAQIAAPLLLRSSATPPRRILDACAAPGGKTAHLLELADCEVTALDIDPQRCRRIEENLARLDLKAKVKVIAGDAAKPLTWWDQQPFDAILLDAPCTASGIVRRHPDVRWLRRQSDVAQLAATQLKLLETLWPLLAPGGVLVYCTCSVFREEGESQVQTFLAHNTGAFLQAAPGHLLPGAHGKGEPLPDNAQGGQHATHDRAAPGVGDGFFYAVLQKHA